MTMFVFILKISFRVLWVANRFVKTERGEASFTLIDYGFFLKF